VELQELKKNYKKLKEVSKRDIIGDNMKFGQIPSNKKCDHCKKHKATVIWLGSGGMLEYTHGMCEYICICCSLKAQLKYAKEQAERIPELEKELKECKCK
jgi:hypothetical protein